MRKMIPYYLILLFMVSFACTKGEDEIILDAETQALVDLLKEELYPLPVDPLTWSDEDLQFLDPMADKSVIALGEATQSGKAEEKEYQLHARLLRVVQQVSEVIFANKTEDYYSVFYPEYLDWLIYFDQTTASVIL